MVTLSSQLDEVFSSESSAEIRNVLKVSTLADLLALFPFDYVEPRRWVAINLLQVGYEVCVKGQIASRTEQLIRVPRTGETITVPVVFVSDGTGSICIRWIDQRHDVPPGLFPGESVAIVGFPQWSPVRNGLGPGVQFYMDDPAIGVIADWRTPAPFFDAPGPRYTYDEGHKTDFHASAISMALDDLLPLPESIALVDGEFASGSWLGYVIKAIHRPMATDERNYGWANREWAKNLLQRVQVLESNMPEARLIKTPNDAEKFARDFLVSLGFADAILTSGGRDGGVDVRGGAVVAQVKLEGVKTDAPRLQSLSGIAAHEQRIGAFFSLSGYTAPATAWAERTGMALFEFDYSGGITPRSSEAHRLMASGIEPPIGNVDAHLRKQVEEALKDVDESFRGETPS